MRTLTHAEWKAEGAHRFGDDINNWDSEAGWAGFYS